MKVLNTVVCEPDEGVSAAFLRNHHGKVCIAFADPAYVRADAIVVDLNGREVHAVLHQASYFISTVSDVMASALAESAEALLTSVKPDGTIFELFAPVQVNGA